MHTRAGDLHTLQLHLPGRAGCGCGGGLCRRCASGCVGQARPIDAAGGIAAQLDGGTFDAHRAQGHALVERAHLAQRHDEFSPRQHGRTSTRLQLQIAHAQLAADAKLRRLAAGLRETQRQLGSEGAAARLQGQRQAQWQVGPPGAEIDLAQRHADLAGMVAGKGQGLAAQVDRAVVELEGQPRLDLDLQVIWKVRQERHGQVHAMQPVLALHGLVVELHFAVTQLHIEECESRRLVLGLGDQGRDAREHVVDVPRAGLAARQAQARRVDLERRDHRRQPPQ